MDSQHRHDLQQNDLAQTLTHLGDWWAKHGTKLLVAVLAVLVVIAGVQWTKSRARAAEEQAQSELAMATSPQAFRAIAEESKDPNRRALALLRGGDLLLDAAVRPVGAVSAGTVVGSLDPQADLTHAAEMYQKVIDDSRAHLAFRLNAMLGLASVRESQNDLAAARELYGKVIEQAGTTLPVIARKAQARLDMVGELSRPVVFGKNPEPSEPPQQPGNAGTSALPGMDSSSPVMVPPVVPSVSEADEQSPAEPTGTEQTP